MLASEEDAAEAQDFNWFAHKRGRNGVYAARKEKGRTISFHRQVLGVTNKPEVRVDHRRGVFLPADPRVLDNRRDNLRVASKAQNARGYLTPRKNKTSKYRGVCRRNSIWLAQTHYNGKKIHLGHFKIEGDAARAYDAFAVKNFGEFAQLNFPYESRPLSSQLRRAAELEAELEARKDNGPG